MRDLLRHAGAEAEAPDEFDVVHGSIGMMSVLRGHSGGQ